jgi:pimeloyl-ACP methyl ester carboxylesterase
MDKEHFTEKINLNDWWDIPVTYHPTKTGKIIINIPGAGGSLDGYKNKYLNLGNYMQRKDIASFVRISNDRPQDTILTARTVINYSVDNAKEICGLKKPEIWLMGFSAGGASVLLTAWEYPEIKKVLAINPFLEFKNVRKDIKKYLPRYEGKTFVVIGEEDSVIATDTIQYIHKYAKDIKTYLVPQCDHQFTGRDNSKLLSQLPGFFFRDLYINQSSLPSPDSGIVLLDS